MAARCASCSYPLSVSDSVSCCECLSYFHIDCAQLVGFPYYELSSDPVRNTFHCQTCKIIPLPQQSDGFSDSDSGDECTMPSRQLDYHLEGQPDFVKDMNEVKGSVQDLSELCKDVFREINELKSINLTLRCCVENLRHDGEQRDELLSELRRRIEALEGKSTTGTSSFRPIHTASMYVDKIVIEKEEEVERFLTPDPEYSRLKDNENAEQGNLLSEETTPTDVIQDSIRQELESGTLIENKITGVKRPHNWEPTENVTEVLTTEDVERVESDFEEKSAHRINEEDVYFAEEETITTTASELNTDERAVGSVRDWDWRGSKAIPLKEYKNEDSAGEEDDDDEEEEDNKASDIEDTETQGWEILEEDIKQNEELLQSARCIEVSEELADNKMVTWADEVGDQNKEEESVQSNEEAEITILKSEAKYLTETFQGRIESKSALKEEDTEEPKEYSAGGEAEGEETTSLKGEEGDETPTKLEVDIETIEGGAEVEDYIKAIYTGRVNSVKSPRLEGEPRLEEDSSVEGGAVPKGEVTEGGQSPESQGEVQPSELTESTEPPPPPQPEHSPDDLWDYLKDAVTGEHPATVEEFVQKLIGTLEHVPEEYLKPVIDYNIKRANSPSVTDGEHLDAKEGDHHIEDENREVDQTGSGEVRPDDNCEIRVGHTSSLPEGEAAVRKADGFHSGDTAAPHDDVTNITENPSEEPSESTEGYPPLEAAA